MRYQTVQYKRYYCPTRKKEKTNEAEAVFKEITAENSQNLTPDINQQI